MVKLSMLNSLFHLLITTLFNVLPSSKPVSLLLKIGAKAVIPSKKQPVVSSKSKATASAKKDKPASSSESDSSDSDSDEDEVSIRNIN